jgi:hypothetical protein
VRRAVGLEVGVDPVPVAGERHLALPQQRQQHGEVLLHVLGRLGERQPEHHLDHDLVGQADAEREAPAGGVVRRRRLLGHGVRVPGERRHHERPELDRRRRRARHRAHRHGVEPEDVREPHRREAVGLRLLGGRDRIRHRAAAASESDPHA